MAITKEDGTGLATANVYADLSDLESHALLRGEDISGYSDTQKEAALYISANDWIDTMHNFKGSKVSDDQGMKLYTDEVTFDDASKDIVAANCNTAILHLKGKLFVDPSVQDVSGDIKRTKSKLDVLEKEVEYTEGTQVIDTYDTPIADRLLRPYLSYSSAGVRMLRV